MSSTLPPSAKSIRRTRTVVDQDVQFGVIKKIAVHWVAFFLCNTIALLMWLRLLEQPDATWQDTWTTFLNRFAPFLVISMALVPAFVWDTLKMTNRFAGPITRLRREINNAAAGRVVSPLSFRSNDYWREIASDFNNLVKQAGIPTTSVPSATESPSDPESAR